MVTTRTKNATTNLIIITIMQVMAFIYSLVTKKVFLSEFSLSIYGVIDLFSSFFQSLMLLEMGFGTILIFNLYKPLALNDKEEVRKQLSIFKTIYMILILVILTISIILAPFLYNIFNISYGDMILVYEIYFANILCIVIKYWTLNKVSILSANQYKYIENIACLIVDFISFIGRMITIIVFKNVYLYILFQLLFPTLAYIFETIWVNKNYDVRCIKMAPLKEMINSGVLVQCKNYIYATIYTLVFVSMDNIIISAILSTDAVAYVSNYNGLLMTGSQFVAMIIMSIRGIMADYRHNQKSIEGFYDVFNVVSSLNFIIVSLMIVGFYVLIDDFIALWIGSEFIIENNILISLLMVRLLECLFLPVENVFVIEGYIFKERLPLIFSALTNLVLTILLVNKIGLVGAYIATVIALLIKWGGKLFYVLGGIFNKFKIKVLSRYSLYLLMIIIEMVFVNFIATTLIPSVNSLIMFIFKFVIVILTVGLVNCIITMMNKSVRTYTSNLLRCRKKQNC